MKGRMREVALKIVISKAYELVDWRYLINVMTKMCFSEK
jgi:hypothetical protein